MPSSQLFIPDKIRVGAQDRTGTYTGRLAYVIYYDQKGVLRKQKSWDAWRDHKIAPVDYDNAPTEGFVLNKKVGGYKSDWHFRDAHVRVYDPRGFEFEIDVPNLLYILQEATSTKGKGLEGKFVYAWAGTELVLLPVTSADYANSKTYTALQGGGVKSKDMIPGAVYVTKKQEELIYVGRYDYHFLLNPRASRSNKEGTGVCKRYVFWGSTDTVPYDEDEDDDDEDTVRAKKRFVTMDALARIGTLKSDAVSPDLANLIYKYGRSSHGSAIESLFLKEVTVRKPHHHYNSADWFFEASPGVFFECYTEFAHADRNKIACIRKTGEYRLKKGVLYYEVDYVTAVPPGVGGWRSPVFPYREPTTNRLFAKMKSGATIRVSNSDFEKGK